MAKKRCWNCDGHGTERLLIGGSDTGPLVLQTVGTCSVCGGSGRIPPRRTSRKRRR